MDTQSELKLADPLLGSETRRNSETHQDSKSSSNSPPSIGMRLGKILAFSEILPDEEGMDDSDDGLVLPSIPLKDLKNPRSKHFSSARFNELQGAAFNFVDWGPTWIRYQSVTDKVHDRDNGAGDIAKAMSDTPHHWAGILTSGVLTILAVISTAWTYRKQKTEAWNHDPRNFAKLLFNDNNWKDRIGCQLRIAQLNDQLKEMLAKSPELRSKYQSMRFGLDPPSGEFCFTYKKNPQAPEEKEQKKSLYDRLLSVGSWFKQFMTWPGFWFWVVMMNSTFYVGSFDAALTMPWYAFMALLVPSLIFTAYKAWNFLQHEFNPKSYKLGKTEQEDLVTVFRNLINQRKYDEANEPLKSAVEPDDASVPLKLDAKADDTSASLELDAQAKVMAKVEAKEEKRKKLIKDAEVLCDAGEVPEGKLGAEKNTELTPIDHIRRLGENQNKKLAMATVNSVVSDYAVATFFVPYLQCTVSSFGGEIPDNTLSILGVMMIVIVASQGMFAYHEKDEELKKIKAKVEGALDESKAKEEGSTAYLLKSIDDDFKRLQKLKHKVTDLEQQLAEQRDKNAKNVNRMLPGCGKAPAQPPQVEVAPPVVDFFDPIAFEDVRRTAPDNSRKSKQYLKYGLIFTGCTQTGILMARVVMVEGTGTLPFIDKVPIDWATNSVWTSAHAFWLTAALAGLIWASVKLLDYVVSRRDHRAKLFLEQMPERAEVLQMQLEHYALRVISLSKQLDAEKLNKVGSSSVTPKTNGVHPIHPTVKPAGDLTPTLTPTDSKETRFSFEVPSDRGYPTPHSGLQPTSSFDSATTSVATTPPTPGTPVLGRGKIPSSQSAPTSSGNPQTTPTTPTRVSNSITFSFDSTPPTTPTPAERTTTPTIPVSTSISVV